jgi:hypothetical protein
MNDLHFNVEECIKKHYPYPSYTLMEHTKRMIAYIELNKGIASKILCRMIDVADDSNCDQKSDETKLAKLINIRGDILDKLALEHYTLLVQGIKSKKEINTYIVQKGFDLCNEKWKTI